MTHFMTLEELHDNAWEKILYDYDRTTKTDLVFREEFREWCDEIGIDILFRSRSTSHFDIDGNLKEFVGSVKNITKEQFEFSIGIDEGFIFTSTDDFLLFKLTWL